MAEKTKKRPGRDRGYLLSLLISVLAALLVGAGIMALAGQNPLTGYGALLKGALGSPRDILAGTSGALRPLANTLAKSMTLCLTGLATAVAARAGIFNVGGEGQLYLGAVASAYLGARLSGQSPLLALPLCFLAAIAAGGLYAFIPGLLKVKLKVNEVITTIMLNSAAIYFCSYLATGPLKTAERGIKSGTDAIDKAFQFTKLVPLSNLTQAIFYAAGIAFVVWYVMGYTSRGLEMKLTGQNERFARYVGIRSGKTALWAMVASGAICGLVGMFESFGLHGRFLDTVSKDFYFDGMLVAMIMRYRPVGIIAMSLFFGALKIGSSAMELQTGIPGELIQVVQSIIIFFMAAEEGIAAQLRMGALKRKARAQGRLPV